MGDLLPQTWNNIKDCMIKIDAMDNILTSLGRCHTDDKAEAELLYKDISKRKLVLSKEIFRLLS